ncbi:hypothetical protein RND81_02G027200 [Saponaria officinalis]|uniref:Uncharacterized protein n=1 Tax=Saponaria officinalis TaxID=3572 RepID=A0AAW1MMA8_SAPOF
MEEEKAAAYYDELTRKGSGAARFKQGLGFSSAATTTVADDPPPVRGSALPPSSFLSNFVKSSNPSEVDKQQSQLQSIQNKLQKKQSTHSIDRKPPSDDEIRVRVRVSDRERGRDDDRRREREKRRDRRSRSRSRSRSRERGSRSRRRYRSSSRERRSGRRRRSLSRDSERGRDRRRRRSRSLSPRGRNSERGRDNGRDRRGRSRSLSPKGRNSERGRGGDDGGGRKKGVVDYARLIDGYDKMTPAERVKAKMKLQLSQTAEKDEKMGAGSQWERFDFDKDAPIEDEILEAADDDAAVSKRIGQSFRFASLEGKREDDVRNAHDEAMFGVPARQPSQTSESENESENEERQTDDTNIIPASSLLNEKVLSKQQGSWRDRARRNVG